LLTAKIKAIYVKNSFKQLISSQKLSEKFVNQLTRGYAGKNVGYCV